MTHPTSDFSLTSPECAAVERQLADYLEGTLAAAARLSVDEHLRTCASCSTMVGDVDDIVHQASALPVLTPSRDLWSGIESRLDTAVIPLGARAPNADSDGRPANRTDRRRTVSVRTFAVAAALLIAVTSAVTWRLARVPAGEQRAPELAANSTPSVPSVNALARTDSTPSGATASFSVDSAVPATLVASSQADVDAIYEREIASLRRVVNERVVDLDSSTVNALQRNLAIIDAAIADSRRALKRDPKSRLLSNQLDRALENKLALMRRVALL